MWQGLRRGVLSGILVLGAMAVVAPGAWASISPTLSLNQSAGTTAGSVANLGVDLKFAPTGSDSPDDMTLNLPPGLLADASIDGGACLTAADLSDTACQVGSGTVTADAYGTIPITTPVTFDLVPPPAAGDLAGLAVNSSGTQVGSTADIKIRPSGNPGGVGITINFVLPNILYGVPISIAEIKLDALTIELPTGISFVRRQAHHKLEVTGVSLTGAKLKSLSISHGHLVITLRKAVSSLTVKISTSALKESTTLKSKAKQLRSLLLTVITENTRAKRTTIRVRITSLGL